MSQQPPYQTYPLGDFALQTGTHIPQAHLAYKTYGDPQNPTIIYPTWFSGLIADNEWLISPTQTLDPTRYFIIVPALFGNSQSSSPSNRPDLRPFPHVSFYDNVRAQHALVTQHLGIQHVRAVLGWSMGAAQSFQWATQYPGFMDLVVPFYPENMLVMLHTWQAGDCSNQEPYQGDFAAAMRGIKAKALVLPCKTDLYFPPEDSEIEVNHMRDGIGELKVFPSIWGHWAGGPGQSAEDVKWLDERLREFFEKN
ncbi:hypothetical protein KC332_g4234 [Hortaea werneckii]|nr:hypothetical protein KC350_g4239 [Hortaea werneckii]KAI6908828.1 hypothetical protein KC348_g13722 [Hortaea werneckii]KAI6938351.1 hypothetical protein KC341_g4960 [Hortaea werneckii]KAI6960651.1 hypothetical protein KC321_g12742 [Hortaea werneckii]KAI6963580.1 hypothetical protein KC329_g15914 [Hortaea werneckii]